MSALRVYVYFESAELDTFALPREHWLRVLHACNSLWKEFETDEVKYRTLPEDDGYLYVTPGNFHECQCSDAEAMLEDEYPYNLDDHHFYQTQLPEGIEEKTMIYDEDGELAMKKLVGGVHPLYDPQSPDALSGMYARFEVVD